MMTSIIVLIIALVLVGPLMSVKDIPGYVPATVVILPAIWVLIDLIMWISDHLYIPGLGWLLLISICVGGLGGISGAFGQSETVIKHGSDERVTRVEIKKKK